MTLMIADIFGHEGTEKKATDYNLSLDFEPDELFSVDVTSPCPSRVHVQDKLS